MDFCLPAAYHEVQVVQETAAPTSMSQPHEISESATSKMKESSIKRKRKRSQAWFKSSEEMEIERKIHIEVERNRRKQMNEHLQALRQLMPSSYVQRGDHASIIGGTIEFVKDLEKKFKFLESQKRHKMSCGHHEPSSTVQVINKSKNNTLINTHLSNNNIIEDMHQHNCLGLEKEMREKRNITVDTISSLMDVQVKLIEPDEAVIKILSQKRPSQLLKIIVALQEDLHLTILRTTITTIDQAILYSFKVKISDPNP